MYAAIIDHRSELISTVKTALQNALESDGKVEYPIYFNLDDNTFLCRERVVGDIMEPTDENLQFVDCVNTTYFDKTDAEELLSDEWLLNNAAENITDWAIERIRYKEAVFGNRA